jgi:hypothetical protein
MRHSSWILALIVALGPAVAARADDPPPAKVDAEKIDKLIKQLNSNKFSERVLATRELDAIGVPALEALRKAAKSDGAEVSKRAAELIKKIEERTLTSTLLAPTRLRLVFKDTPVPDAVAELAKKSGYPIQLEGNKEELAKRKITLDTGETTFWQALDMLCQKANLVETNAPNRFGGPGLKLPPPKLEKPQPGVLPVVPQPKPGKIDLLNGQAVGGAQLLQVQVQLPGGGAQQIQIQAVPQIQVQPIQPPIMAPPGRGGVIYNPGQIILTDGKPQNYPTSYHGAVRIRIVPKASVPTPPAGKGEVVLILEATPEPKLLNFNLVGTPTVKKVVDDQDQKLSMAAEPATPEPAQPNPLAGGGGAVGGRRIAQPAPWAMGGQRYAILRLKLGEKHAKRLKELSGTVSASMLAPPEDLVTVDNILKAKGKSVKGKAGGSIEIIDVTKHEGGDIEVQFKMENPPAGGGFGAVVPGPAPRVILPPKVPAMPAQIQVQIGGGVARPAIAYPSAAPGGISLQDAKGTAFQVVRTQVKGSFDGKVFTQEHTMVFRGQKDQGEAVRLVYSGRRTVTVQIPFAFKNVTLP